MFKKIRKMTPDVVSVPLQKVFTIISHSKTIVQKMDFFKSKNKQKNWQKSKLPPESHFNIVRFYKTTRF